MDIAEGDAQQGECQHVEHGGNDGVNIHSVLHAGITPAVLMVLVTSQYFIVTGPHARRIEHGVFVYRSTDVACSSIC